MNHNRRTFLRTVTLAVGALAVAPVVKIRDVLAAHVDTKSALAVALKYKENAKDAPERKDKKAFCKNCSYFQTKDAKAKTAPCQLMAGAEVNAEGWCNSWSKKA